MRNMKGGVGNRGQKKDVGRSIGKMKGRGEVRYI
jgi:hypothetical protein